MNERIAVAIWIGLSSLAAGAGHANPAKFKITTRRTDDAVEVRTEKDKTVFIVTSPTGIGQATIKRTDDEWPAAIVLRLKLKGLEHFRVTCGKVVLDAAVSGFDAQPTVRVWKDGREDAPLDDESPYWTDIRACAADGTSVGQIPIEDGYFEMQFPRALLKGQPRSLVLDWIDFYRS